MSSDPWTQFRCWFDEAVASEPHEPNAMVVSTCSPQGQPSSRVLLLKELDERGLVFYTNLDSRKSREARQNACASALFFWPERHRQVRVEGQLELVEAEIADAYFASRPRDAQLGAWASQQSQPIADRGAFEQRLNQFSQRFAEQDIPRPPHWGGWRLLPERFEFWQGQPNRLHDRFVYLPQGEGWSRQRLMP